MLLLITGASGVGKSTVREYVAPVLAPTVEAVELKDIADPSRAHTLAWRQKAAETAVRRAVALQAESRHLLLAGDPVAAVEIVAAPSAAELDGLAVCLLDADPGAQAARLRGRGDPEALLENHRAFADWMRHQASDPLHMLHVVSRHSARGMRWDRLETMADQWATEIIDTSELTPVEVAERALDWCERAVAGTAPTLRVPRGQMT